MKRVEEAQEVQMSESSQAKRGEESSDMDIDDDGEARRTMCLNLLGDNYSKTGQECMIKADEETEPIFLVMSDSAMENTRHRIWESQKERMSYVVHIPGSDITTNSSHVIAQLKIKNLLEDVDLVDGELC